MTSTNDYLPSNALQDASDVQTSRTEHVAPGEFDDALANAESGTEYVLEAGAYDISGDHDPEANCVIRGQTDGDGNPTTRLTYGGGSGRWVIRGECDGDFAVQNLVLDYSSGGDGNLGLLLRVGGHGLVKNVRWAGYNSTEGEGSPVDNIAPSATDSDGTFVVRDCVRDGPTNIAPHGSQTGSPNEGWLWSGNNHKGSIYVCDCRIENTGTNSIYASRTNGSIHVHRCLFRNNNQTSIRIGGGQGTSTISESCFIIDCENAHPDNDGGYINPNWLVAETQNTKGGVESVPVEITDTDFLLKSGPSRARGMYIDGNAGPITFERCRFESRSGHALIQAESDPRWANRAPDQSIAFIDCAASGDGGIEIMGDRPATWDGGCCAVATSGVEHSGNVATSGCDRPGETLPGGGTPTVGGGGGSGSGGRSPPDDARELVVTGTGTETNYVVETDGEVFRTSDVEDWDTTADGTIEGWITEQGDTDTFQITGTVESVTFPQGVAMVTVAGEPVGPAGEGDAPDRSDPTPPADGGDDSTGGDGGSDSDDSAPEETRELVVTGTGEKTDYVIETTGKVEKTGDIEDWDTTANGVIDGWITKAGATDTYRITGDVESVTIREGDAAVTVDGEVVRPPGGGESGAPGEDDDESDAPDEGGDSDAGDAPDDGDESGGGDSSGDDEDGGDDSPADDPATESRTLALSFPSGGTYGFCSSGEITASPASATPYEAGDGQWRAHAYAQSGWSAEFEFVGELAWADVPDDAEMTLDGETLDA